MTCDDALGALHDRLDGPLDPARDPALRDHLATCEACRALARDLDELRAAARALPRERPPTRDLWSGIEARLRPTPTRWWHRPTWLAAALVLVAVGSSAATALALRGPAPVVPVVPVAAAETDELERAAAELRGAVEARRGELDPEVLAVVEENLALVDRAIAETRAALAEHPGDERLEHRLKATSEQRLVLLRQVLDVARNG